MLYLLYGDDSDLSRKKLQSLLMALFKKRPNAEYFHITDENYEAFSIESLIQSQGLFEQKYIVVFDHLFEDAEKKETLLSTLKEMKEVEHLFIFLEEKLDKKTIEKFEKYSEKVETFVLKEKKYKERFNTFALTDALGKRDKKTLWVLYQKAERAHIAPEEVHGILFWQVKSMLLAGLSRSADEAKLNPFVFKKSKEFLRNYREGEVQNLSKRLVTLSHDARRGIHDFNIALECFILSI